MKCDIQSRICDKSCGNSDDAIDVSASVRLKYDEHLRSEMALTKDWL